MNGFLEILSAAKFDLLLVMVTVAFGIFSHRLLEGTRKRSDEFAPVMRDWQARLDSIAPRKPKTRSVAAE